MKVVITGGADFVGLYLAEFLLCERHHVILTLPLTTIKGSLLFSFFVGVKKLNKFITQNCFGAH